MSIMLESDQTKAWHIYKETDEVERTFKNWGPRTIHFYIKAEQMIYEKTCIWHSMFLLVKVHRENCVLKTLSETALMTGPWSALMDWKSGPSEMNLPQIW